MTESARRSVSREAAGKHSLRGVGRHLRREGHTGELVHGVDEQGRSLVDCGCRLDGVTTAWTACGLASASARAGRHTEPAVLPGTRAEAKAMGPAASRYFLLVLCCFEQAAVTRDGVARERERARAMAIREERDTLVSDESAKHLSQIRHKPKCSCWYLPGLAQVKHSGARGRNQQSTKDRRRRVARSYHVISSSA